MYNNLYVLEYIIIWIMKMWLCIGCHGSANVNILGPLIHDQVFSEHVHLRTCADRDIPHYMLLPEQ